MDSRKRVRITARCDMLAPHFSLLMESRSLPFVIRETRNKFQHSFSELTVWEKNRASEKT